MPIEVLQYGVKVRDPTTKQFSDLAALRGGQGPQGTTGPGVPAGGTDGDVLVKNGATDYAAKWERPYSRPNLLDNWYFINPVNQRGLSIYNISNSREMTIDRWFSYDGGQAGKIEVTSDGVAVTKTSGGAAYTLGIIFYAKGVHKRYFHTIFHLFILAGSAFHFVAIFKFCIFKVAFSRTYFRIMEKKFFVFEYVLQKCVAAFFSKILSNVFCSLA
jgi:hypothetical protein